MLIAFFLEFILQVFPCCIPEPVLNTFQCERNVVQTEVDPKIINEIKENFDSKQSATEKSRRDDKA